MRCPFLRPPVLRRRRPGRGSSDGRGPVESLGGARLRAPRSRAGARLLRSASSAGPVRSTDRSRRPRFGECRSPGRRRGRASWTTAGAHLWRSCP
ncbi:hypothetical protein SLNWT_6626 [Streptomyces albus]|uniref:Uncharacterized protein n=1 Tax=Streptomyces albus (strain ATCC 21838 / DSM 41398 / FERM P-419 / JCM 4703 / NBRC 107858) TaxID=1081613 RepID=A0A0B5F942_STRA4|nr:hypothetical protein SLNWT_6626 [Streptomyces albus]AOU81306.1 hypothetical protein SLNHY_6615 [Streptomyces albus]AYN36997.1 hypothetical protein DUI70_6506 [Streptomyces albus]